LLSLVIPMPESSDLSLVIDRVGKGWFSILCHRSELIGSDMKPSPRRRGSVTNETMSPSEFEEGPPRRESAAEAQARYETALRAGCEWKKGMKEAPFC
jgi:hypothetical protein